MNGGFRRHSADLRFQRDMHAHRSAPHIGPDHAKSPRPAWVPPGVLHKPIGGFSKPVSPVRAYFEGTPLHLPPRGTGASSDAREEASTRAYAYMHKLLEVQTEESKAIISELQQQRSHLEEQLRRARWEVADAQHRSVASLRKITVSWSPASSGAGKIFEVPSTMMMLTKGTS